MRCRNSHAAAAALAAASAAASVALGTSAIGSGRRTHSNLEQALRIGKPAARHSSQEPRAALATSRHASHIDSERRWQPQACAASAKEQPRNIAVARIKGAAAPRPHRQSAARQLRPAQTKLVWRQKQQQPQVKLSPEQRLHKRPLLATELPPPSQQPEAQWASITEGVLSNILARLPIPAIRNFQLVRRLPGFGLP